jgi:saccharopine dehydrogenase-like NADP-dependent oxidoreductase
MRGKTCAGTYVMGRGKDGRPRETYLHHVVDNEQSMAEWGHQAVVLQTALNPVVALELLADGVGRVPACSARRHFRPRHSSSCSPTTVRRTGSRIGRFSG